ncbi:helix-turn-helix domain-containing protein [Amycolatopsis vastitatis]|uniref:Transcriptional regulator n=1 Tax=Amycolatopsis vastitatis TaxID=1905142 RepID=A0A229TKP5_9PSEU|nr:helix-turn-helix transcriptional regulator [Amycolatopsis vastitatis]OXM71703.1 transcriptional regulator [Amycolatopsis vastitatis]
MSERDRDSSATGREIGDELKRFRVGAGLLASDLADMLGCSASKISRMESGVRGYSELDVTMFLATCRASREDVVRVLDLVREQADGYRIRPHREQLPDELRSLIVTETQATEIIEFEPQIIPGILQIEDYARAVFRWFGLRDETGIDVRVQARLRRQKLLRRRDPPRFTFYIQEAALQAKVANDQVMHEQILHLLLTSSFEHCVIRVVPEAACPAGVLGVGFRIMRYNEAPVVAYVENQTASLFLEDPADLEVYRHVLKRLAGHALDGGQSREWLAALASEYDRAKDETR